MRESGCNIKCLISEGAWLDTQSCTAPSTGSPHMWAVRSHYSTFFNVLVSGLCLNTPQTEMRFPEQLRD